MPAWSPDGARLAFSDPIGIPPSYYEIVIQEIASGIAQRLTNNSADDFNPVWSPDGQTIAWTSNHPSNAWMSGIWATPATGAPAYQLCTAGLGPTWSPDGTHLAYAGVNDGSNTLTLWVLNVATRQRNALTLP